MTTQRRRRVTLAIVTAAALVAPLAACAADDAGSDDAVEVPFGPTTAAAASGLDSITWMLPSEPTTLDADIDATTADDTVLANVCERIMQVQPDLSLDLGLAESAEWADDTHLVLTIRDGVTFHDGSALTVDDVLWSLERHAAEGAAESDEYGNVVGMSVTGDREITIETTQPDAILLQALAGDGGIVWNPRVIEEQGDAFGTPSSPDACSGPFELASWEPGDRLVLAAYEDYWDDEGVALSDEVVFRWADESAVVNAIAAGEAHGAYLDNAAAAVNLVGQEGVTVAQGPSTNVWVAIPNAIGALADERIRLALSLALDRQGIADAAFGGLAEPWATPVGSGAWGYEQDAFEAAYDELEGAPASPSEDDIAEAQALVQEVGDVDPIVIGSNGDASRNVIANALVAAAQSIGLEAEIETVPDTQYGDFYSDQAFRDRADIWIDEYYISKNDPLGFYKNGASDSSVNHSGFASDEYDQLVLDAYAATDDAERAELTIELQRQWSESMVWISVVATPSTVITSADVTGEPASASYLYHPWAAALGSVEG